jgi:hypothetical protein
VGRALVFARNVDDPVTDADIDAAARYWAGYKLAGLLTKNAWIHGHRCVAAKDCPGGNVWARLDDIVDLTADYVRNGLPGTGDDDVPLTPEDVQKIAKAVWEHRLNNLVSDTQSPARALLSDTHRNTEQLLDRTEPPAPVA